MSNLPDAAYIRNLRNTGYRDGKDPTYPVCPICEQTCETIYISADNEIVGCDQCKTTRNEWEVTYKGGWTEVEAPSITIAVQAFTAFHRAVTGITACSDIYTESEFRKTGMLDGGNFGAKTREKITIMRELF